MRINKDARFSSLLNIIRDPFSYISLIKQFHDFYFFTNENGMFHSINHNFHYRNICHGSDSVESAKREIDLWFKPEEIMSYNACEAPWLYE